MYKTQSNREKERIKRKKSALQLRSEAESGEIPLSRGAGDVPRAPLFSGGLGRKEGTERLSPGERRKGTASSRAGGGTGPEPSGGGSSSAQHPPAKKSRLRGGAGGKVGFNPS